MRLVCTLLSLFFATTGGYAQSGVDELKELIKEVDSDTTLSVTVLDAVEVYDVALDGGGAITIYHENGVIRKVVRSLGVSYGRIVLTMYPQDGAPGVAVETEENYVWDEGDSGWDYSELALMYRKVSFIPNDTRPYVEEWGERRLSTPLALNDYTRLLDLAGRYISGKE
ncbi:hypothetical protein AB9P05_10995 [Roseivirga sp. BDSF3-8]|uniref:hypothetical protein n=1 Tax=Roseivirga sp. BDSF3-8 TaxID=3241598 RepID=UPI003531AEA0